ncbi:MAG: helix-turn-helix domain-containing protein [bacterium]
MEEKLYSIEEAAKALGLSEKTIRRYIKDGKIKAIKVEGRYSIPEGEIARESLIKQYEEEDRKEIDSLLERIKTLEEDKIFLQGQISELQRHIQSLIQELSELRKSYDQLVTAKALLPPKEGFISRIKRLWR